MDKGMRQFPRSQELQKLGCSVLITRPVLMEFVCVIGAVMALIVNLDRQAR
jgi:hypothetical protein